MLNPMRTASVARRTSGITTAPRGEPVPVLMAVAAVTKVAGEFETVNDQ